jgi:hypothetical protein
MTIVQVNVSQTVGAAPNQLQRTGAILSIGGTSLAANASSLITQPSDLTPLLAAGISITAASTTWSSGTVTMTTATAHGYTTGDTVTVSGFSGAGYVGYNGTYVITVTSATAFTYAQSATLTSPSSGTAIVTDADVAELVAQVGTFFAQGFNLAVYVLEMGHGTVVSDIAEFAAYLIANPLQFYAYLIPRGWDAQATFVTLCGLYNSPTAKQYFCVTATLSTYASFTATMKCVAMLIEAASIPATEFTMAARFYNILKYQPSATNQVTPLQYAFVYGVTAYGATNAQQATFKAANLDYIMSGAEGGISNLILALGTQCDGNPYNYWYSVDWMQINVDLQEANTIINGSNNTLAPLYYNQNGINTLENTARKVANQAVSYGLAIGPVTTYSLTAAQFTALLTSGNAPLGVLVNAVPFFSWVTLNPLTYPIGSYGGLALVYTPDRGFANIIFNVGVSNLALL